MSIDISAMNFGKLNELNGRIEAGVAEMREQGTPALRQKFMAEAAALGLTIDEIVQPPNGKRCNGKSEPSERTSR